MADLQKLREHNLQHTIQAIKESVGDDDLIIQAIRAMDDLDKVGNILSSRLRDWYALYNPELAHTLADHQRFVDLILSQPKAALLKSLQIKESMGADLPEPDVEAIRSLASQCQSLFASRAHLESYLETKMTEAMPNVQAVAGTTMGARLLELAGSLKRLASLPASTVQILGAEKALFRHLTTKARAPKHGILVMHPLVAKARAKGRAARILADKISIAARIDYFKGEFQGDELRKQVEEKL